MGIIEALDVIAELPTVPEMAKACRKEIDRLHRLVREYERENIALQTLRPVWAQGWTTDSEAAQASAASLSEIWKLLGVSNQSDAIQKIKELSQ